MINEKTEILLTKYLNKECTPEEISEVELWLASEENREYLESYRKIYNLRIKQSFKPNLNRMWDNIEVAIKEEQKLSYKPVEKKSFRIYYYVAAVLAFIGFSVLMFKTNYQTQEIKYMQASVIDGFKKEITLTDGSRIILDAGSKLEYPEEFSVQNRKVKFEGEGYFEIAKDSKRPFIIYAGGMQVKVLGTKFIIKNRKLSSEKLVHLIEGKVLLKTNLDSVYMNPNQTGIVSIGNSILLNDENRDFNLDAWMQNIRTYKNTELREILDDIQRWYRVKITIKNSGRLDERLTLRINKKGIDEALNVISVITGLKSEWKNGNEVVLY